MLSGVLRSETAVKISIQIMDAFVSMRKFISSNALIFQRLDKIEIKQISNDKKFEQVFDAIESKNIKPEKGIFYEGQVFDAHKFVSGLIRDAKKSIFLIDNYIDESTFSLFTKTKAKVTIYTRNVNNNLELDVKKYNSLILWIILRNPIL